MEQRACCGRILRRLKDGFSKARIIELKDKTEKGFDEFIEKFGNDGFWQFLVYIRQKYEWEVEWEYTTEFCMLDYPNDTLTWEMDWNGGQKVEYLAVCCIK